MSAGWIARVGQAPARHCRAFEDTAAGIVDPLWSPSTLAGHGLAGLLRIGAAGVSWCKDHRYVTDRDRHTLRGGRWARWGRVGRPGGRGPGAGPDAPKTNPGGRGGRSETNPGGRAGRSETNPGAKVLLGSQKPGRL